MARRHRLGLALAGGGPFGAVYEIGALIALEEALEGLDLNRLDCYVGVSAGSFLSAALANGVPIADIYRLFVAEAKGESALAPGLFKRPAWREYARALVERRIPSGLFDNDPIRAYLAEVFSRPGRSDDFRELSRRLYVVATDLDSGESVSFGRPGHDTVPISRAVQASAALPGLYPPVEIGGRFFVDGALKKTLHASEALDDGIELLLCVNPIVAYDADRAAAKEGAGARRLAEAGLPIVLSQAFRAIIHSRMALGISKYRTQYRGSDVLLFEPESGDSEIFFTNLFSYASRRRLCEHAYRSTRADLARRRETLEPLLARHGIRLRRERLGDAARRIAIRPAPRGALARLSASAAELRDTLAELRTSIDPRA